MNHSLEKIQVFKLLIRISINLKKYGNYYYIAKHSGIHPAFCIIILLLSFFSIFFYLAFFWAVFGLFGSIL